MFRKLISYLTIICFFNSSCILPTFAAQQVHVDKNDNGQFVLNADFFEDISEKVRFSDPLVESKQDKFKSSHKSADSPNVSSSKTTIKEVEQRSGINVSHTSYIDLEDETNLNAGEINVGNNAIKRPSRDAQGNLDGQNLFEYLIEPDGHCAVSCLGLSREKAVRQLIVEGVKNADIRKALMRDVLSIIGERENNEHFIPGVMDTQVYWDLYFAESVANSEVAKEMERLNDFYQRKGKNRKDDLKGFYDMLGEPGSKLTALEGLVDVHNQKAQQKREYLLQPENFESIIKHGYGLPYQDNWFYFSYDAIDVLAEINGLHVIIKRLSADNTYDTVHEHPVENGRVVIMLHTMAGTKNGFWSGENQTLNHFNRLSIRRDVLISPSDNMHFETKSNISGMNRNANNTVSNGGDFDLVDKGTGSVIGSLNVNQGGNFVLNGQGDSSFYFSDLSNVNLYMNSLTIGSCDSLIFDSLLETNCGINLEAKRLINFNKGMRVKRKDGFACFTGASSLRINNRFNGGNIITLENIEKFVVTQNTDLKSENLVINGNKSTTVLNNGTIDVAKGVMATGIWQNSETGIVKVGQYFEGNFEKYQDDGETIVLGLASISANHGRITKNFLARYGIIKFLATLDIPKTASFKVYDHLTLHTENNLQLHSHNISLGKCADLPVIEISKELSNRIRRLPKGIFISANRDFSNNSTIRSDNTSIVLRAKGKYTEKGGYTRSGFFDQNNITICSEVMAQLNGEIRSYNDLILQTKIAELNGTRQIDKNMVLDVGDLRQHEGDINKAHAIVGTADNATWGGKNELGKTGAMALQVAGTFTTEDSFQIKNGQMSIQAKNAQLSGNFQDIKRAVEAEGIIILEKGLNGNVPESTLKGEEIIHRDGSKLKVAGTNIEVAKSKIIVEKGAHVEAQDNILKTLNNGRILNYGFIKSHNSYFADTGFHYRGMNEANQATVYQDWFNVNFFSINGYNTVENNALINFNIFSQHRGSDSLKSNSLLNLSLFSAFDYKNIERNALIDMEAFCHTIGRDSLKVNALGYYTIGSINISNNPIIINALKRTSYSINAWSPFNNFNINQEFDARSWINRGLTVASYYYSTEPNVLLCVKGAQLLLTTYGVIEAGYKLWSVTNSSKTDDPENYWRPSRVVNRMLPYMGPSIELASQAKRFALSSQDFITAYDKQQKQILEEQIHLAEQARLKKERQEKTEQVRREEEGRLEKERQEQLESARLAEAAPLEKERQAKSGNGKAFKAETILGKEGADRLGKWIEEQKAKALEEEARLEKERQAQLEQARREKEALLEKENQQQIEQLRLEEEVRLEKERQELSNQRWTFFKDMIINAIPGGMTVNAFYNEDNGYNFVPHITGNFYKTYDNSYNCCLTRNITTYTGEDHSTGRFYRNTTTAQGDFITGGKKNVYTDNVVKIGGNAIVDDDFSSNASKTIVMADGAMVVNKQANAKGDEALFHSKKDMTFKGNATQKDGISIISTEGKATVEKSANLKILPSAKPIEGEYPQGSQQKVNIYGDKGATLAGSVQGNTSTGLFSKNGLALATADNRVETTGSLNIVGKSALTEAGATHKVSNVTQHGDGTSFYGGDLTPTNREKVLVVTYGKAEKKLDADGYLTFDKNNQPVMELVGGEGGLHPSAHINGDYVAPENQPQEEAQPQPEQAPKYESKYSVQLIGGTESTTHVSGQHTMPHGLYSTGKNVLIHDDLNLKSNGTVLASATDHVIKENGSSIEGTDIFLHGDKATEINGISKAENNFVATSNGDVTEKSGSHVTAGNNANIEAGGHLDKEDGSTASGQTVRRHGNSNTTSGSLNGASKTIITTSGKGDLNMSGVTEGSDARNQIKGQGYHQDGTRMPLSEVTGIFTPPTANVAFSGQNLEFQAVGIPGIVGLFDQTGPFTNWKFTDYVKVITDQHVQFTESRNSAAKSFELWTNKISTAPNVHLKSPEFLILRSTLEDMDLAAGTKLEAGRYLQATSKGDIITKYAMRVITNETQLDKKRKVTTEKVEYDNVTFIGGTGIPYEYTDPETGITSTRLLGLMIDAGGKFNGTGAKFEATSDAWIRGQRIINKGVATVYNPTTRYEKHTLWSQDEKSTDTAFLRGTASTPGKVILQTTAGGLDWDAPLFNTAGAADLLINGPIKMLPLEGLTGNWDRTNYKYKKTMPLLFLVPNEILDENLRKTKERENGLFETALFVNQGDCKFRILARGPHGERYDINTPGLVYKDFEGGKSTLQVFGNVWNVERLIINNKSRSSAPQVSFDYNIGSQLKSLEVFQNLKDVTQLLNQGEYLQGGKELLNPQAKVSLLWSVNKSAWQSLGQGGIDCDRVELDLKTINQSNGYCMNAPGGGYAHVGTWNMNGTQLDFSHRNFNFGLFGGVNGAPSAGVQAGYSQTTGWTWELVRNYFGKDMHFDVDVVNLNNAHMVLDNPTGIIRKIVANTEQNKSITRGVTVAVDVVQKRVNGSVNYQEQYRNNEPSGITVKQDGSNLKIGDAKMFNGSILEGVDAEHLTSTAARKEVHRGGSFGLGSGPNGLSSASGSVIMNGHEVGVAFDLQNKKGSDNKNQLFNKIGSAFYRNHNNGFYVNGIPLFTSVNGEAWRKFSQDLSDIGSAVVNGALGGLSPSVDNNDKHNVKENAQDNVRKKARDETRKQAQQYLLDSLKDQGPLMDAPSQYPLSGDNDYPVGERITNLGNPVIPAPSAAKNPDNTLAENEIDTENVNENAQATARKEAREEVRKQAQQYLENRLKYQGPLMDAPYQYPLTNANDYPVDERITNLGNPVIPVSSVVNPDNTVPENEAAVNAYPLVMALSLGAVPLLPNFPKENPSQFLWNSPKNLGVLTQTPTQYPYMMGLNRLNTPVSHFGTNFKYQLSGTEIFLQSPKEAGSMYRVMDELMLHPSPYVREAWSAIYNSKTNVFIYESESLPFGSKNSIGRFLYGGNNTSIALARRANLLDMPFASVWAHEGKHLRTCLLNLGLSTNPAFDPLCNKKTLLKTERLIRCFGEDAANNGIKSFLSGSKFDTKTHLLFERPWLYMHNELKRQLGNLPAYQRNQILRQFERTLLQGGSFIEVFGNTPYVNAVWNAMELGAIEISPQFVNGEYISPGIAEEFCPKTIKYLNELPKSPNNRLLEGQKTKLFDIRETNLNLIKKNNIIFTDFGGPKSTIIPEYLGKMDFPPSSYVKRGPFEGLTLPENPKIFKPTFGNFEQAPHYYMEGNTHGWYDPIRDCKIIRGNFTPTEIPVNSRLGQTLNRAGSYIKPFKYGIPLADLGLHIFGERYYLKEDWSLGIKQDWPHAITDGTMKAGCDGIVYTPIFMGIGCAIGMWPALVVGGTFVAAEFIPDVTREEIQEGHKKLYDAAKNKDFWAVMQADSELGFLYEQKITKDILTLPRQASEWCFHKLDETFPTVRPNTVKFLEKTHEDTQKLLKEAIRKGSPLQKSIIYGSGGGAG